MVVLSIIQVRQIIFHAAQRREMNLFSATPDDDQLPSYTDLFVVPSNCKEQQQRRNTYIKNQ